MYSSVLPPLLPTCAIRCSEARQAEECSSSRRASAESTAAPLRAWAGGGGGGVLGVAPPGESLDVASSISV